MLTLSVLCFFITVGSIFCRPEINIDSRIVGGKTAGNGQFPYQISLRSSSNAHFCGGSIISTEWILTAAHCVYGQSPSSIIVVVGTNTLNSGGVSFSVAEIIAHEGYNPQNNANDIAVLRVNGVMLTLSVGVSLGDIAIQYPILSIDLADTITPDNTQTVLSGWGLTQYPGQSLPNNLQYIYLPTISVSSCQNALPGYPIFSTNLCTYQVYGQGACQGDSGGPLVANGQQIGVVSWGIPCAKGSPDIFTSVAAFRSWIRSNTGGI